MAELRETLAAEFEKSSAEPAAVSEVPPTPSSAPVEAAPPSSEAAPVEKKEAPAEGGAKPAETESPKPTGTPELKAGEEKPKEVKPAEVETTEQKTTKSDKAPQSWKGDAKTEWEKLPLPVRQEVIRRERQIDATLREIAPMKAFVENFISVSAPYSPRFKQMKIEPVQAFHKLLEADRMLYSGSDADRAGYAASLLMDYKINIEELDKALSGKAATGGNSAPAAEIEKVLTKHLAPIHEFMNGQQTVQAGHQEELRRQADEKIMAMASDTARYPYFEDLRGDMADWIEMGKKKGLAISLEDAYSKAALAHPDIGPKYIKEREALTARERAETQAAEAAKAKAASVSVSGTPSAPGGHVADPKNLRGVIEAQFAGGRI